MGEKRKVCEEQMMCLFGKLIEVYREYNPDGKYLSLSFTEENGEVYRYINNSYWEDDREFPINVRKVNGEEVI